MDDVVCPSTLALRHVTDALQAQERFSWVTGQDATLFSDTVKDQCHATLDQLRVLKGLVDGSHIDFKMPSIDEDKFLDLKHMVLMNTPESLTDDARNKIYDAVLKMMKGECKTVVSISLLTCPWYEQSQKERGEKAKHNCLLVVFTSFDQQFFSPSNPQVKEKASIIDFGWMQALELSHFGAALAKGRSRFVEAVYGRLGSQVLASDVWKDLQKTVPFATITGTRGFVESCLGQATGGISKKKKNGDLKLKEGTTIKEVCESLRLVHLVDLCLHQTGDFNTELSQSNLSSKAKECLSLVHDLYEHSDLQGCKKQIFDLILEWVKELRTSYQSSSRASSAKSNQNETERLIGQWLMRTRLDGRTISPMQELCDRHSQVVNLMERVGGPVARMHPRQIVLVAVAGSKMYNLDTPTSDVDYMVVYASSTESLLSATSRPQENFESKGLDKKVEYGAMELRAFAETLLKCSVTSLELVYASNHEYQSPVWEELCKERNRFVTEKAIQQYIGLIKNNFRFIDKGKRSEDPKRERKLFYKIFHKLHSLGSMIDGNIPQVRLDGEVRDFIMNVRTRDDEEWSRENLLYRANQDYKKMRERICCRTHRLPENTDYTLVSDWLLKARRISS